MRCERIARVVPPPRVVPRPLARAPNLSLSTRAFSDRARGSRRASNHITVRPVRARTRPSRAIESRATHSLYFSTRAIAPSRPRPETHRSVHRPTTTERAILGAYRETHDRGLSIDRSREDATRANPSPSRARRRTRLARPSRAESSPFSAHAPASRTPARARHRGRPARAHLRARRRRRPTDRPDRPDRPGGWSWMGWIRSWVMIPRSRGVTRYFFRARGRARTRAVGRS